MMAREITAFSANDDKPLDLSDPPSSFTAVTRPETGVPVSDAPEGWAPNIWENYKRMIAPFEDSPPSSPYEKEPPMPNDSDYTDFDGAQARVANGVLYITWTAPNTGVVNLTITPLSQIMQVDWTESEAGVVLYLSGHNPYVYCKKNRELAEFIGAHLEQLCTDEYAQSCPDKRVGRAVAIPMRNA